MTRACPIRPQSLVITHRSCWAAHSRLHVLNQHLAAVARVKLKLASVDKFVNSPRVQVVSLSQAVAASSLFARLGHAQVVPSGK